MVSFGDAHVILFVVSLKVQEKYNGIITSLMRKEELIKLFNQTIIEVGTEVDDAYNRLQLVKNTTGLTLDATFLRLQEANHYLLELHLFIAVVQADVCVLQKQALESKLNYEKRFALAKYFASINEAFKKLYGFPKENGPKNKVSSRWGKISTLAELMSEELKAEYDNLKKAGNLHKLSFKPDAGWEKSNGGFAITQLDAKGVVKAWNEANAKTKDSAFVKSLYGYKYDSAFGLLISKALPDGFGLRGFIFAALLGAVVSSLAAMLNAASTIFTIDIYKKFLNKNASDKNQVLVGRIAVLSFAVIGCLVAPMLANPKLGGVFTFIQEFQGYLSPGILAVFIFGMFSKKAPRFAGALGILTSPIVYGFLQWKFGDIAFLNRMAITFGCASLVMLILSSLLSQITG